MSTSMILLLTIISFSISISIYVFRKFIEIDIKFHKVRMKNYEQYLYAENRIDNAFDHINALKQEQPIPSRYNGKDIKSLLVRVQELEEKNKKILEKIKLIMET